MFYFIKCLGFDAFVLFHFDYYILLWETLLPESQAVLSCKIRLLTRSICREKRERKKEKLLVLISLQDGPRCINT